MVVPHVWQTAFALFYILLYTFSRLKPSQVDCVIDIPVEMNTRKTRSKECYFLTASSVYLFNCSEKLSKHYIKISEKLKIEMNEGRLKKKSDAVTSLTNNLFQMFDSVLLTVLVSKSSQPGEAAGCTNY